MKEFDYDQQQFWESRYEKSGGAPFEWLENYERLRNIILKEALKIYPKETEYLSDHHK